MLYFLRTVSVLVVGYFTLAEFGKTGDYFHTLGFFCVLMCAYQLGKRIEQEEVKVQYDNEVKANADRIIQ
jgi:hypothetical protein